MSSPNTTPLTYNGYVSQLANMAVVQTTTVNSVVQGVDAAFNILIPQALNYAELRIQRDIDLLPAQNRNTYVLTQGVNELSISVNDFVTIRTIGLINGTATTPLLPVSQEFLRNVYGDSSYTAQPLYFAMYGGDAATEGETSNNIIFGPYPDAAYTVSITGMTRLPTLYQNATQALAGTAATFISTYLPDLLIQASMIYVSQYQRNFGPAANDPQMGPTYELQYQNLLRGAQVEEARKRFAASGWSSQSPPIAATPNR